MTLSSSASSLLPTRTLQTSGEAFLTEIHKKMWSGIHCYAKHFYCYIICCYKFIIQIKVEMSFVWIKWILKEDVLWMSHWHTLRKKIWVFPTRVKAMTFSWVLRMLYHRAIGKLCQAKLLTRSMVTNFLHRAMIGMFNKLHLCAMIMVNFKPCGSSKAVPRTWESCPRIFIASN